MSSAGNTAPGFSFNGRYSGHWCIWKQILLLQCNGLFLAV